MLNSFCKKPLYESTRKLALVATGAEKADLVIKDARLVNVCTAEIQEHMDVAISCGRIALVGDAAHCIGDDTTVIDAKGQYIAPGFMDGHLHIESSMVTVSEYARAVIPHGTTAIFPDAHEICNVFGPEGVKAMVEDAKHTPLKVMNDIPSCVPAMPGFEDTGASINAEDIKEMLTWDGVLGLGEMMNFPGTIMGNEAVHEEVDTLLKADQVVTGHYAARELGKELNAYIASGIRSCHESVRPEEIIEKMRRGMYAQMRYGSAWRDLPVVISAILDNKFDDRFVCMVTDDIHPETLISDGHMDYILRLAISLGLDPIKAIQFVTINTASCFRLDHELGSITPGKCADIVFFDDLKDIHVTRTIIDGEIVAENGAMTVTTGKAAFPEHFFHSMHVGTKITADSFVINAPEKYAAGDKIRTRVIEIIPEHAGTYEKFADLPVLNGTVSSCIDQDVMKIAVFERHHETGTKGLGFAKGFGLKRGAIAQTVGHDSHNLLVIGANDEDMALAANTLIESGGGMCAALDGKVISLFRLPIAGLMSDLPIKEVAAQLDDLSNAWKKLGCEINAPYMTMAIISLPCIPELRITNRGLVDCKSFCFVDLFEDSDPLPDLG